MEWFIIVAIIAIVVGRFLYALHMKEKDESAFRNVQQRAKEEKEAELRAIDELNAKSPPLKDGSLLRATIDPILPTALQVTVQLSADARNTLNKGKLWDYSLGEIHNWLYNYELSKYNIAWDAYERIKRLETPNTLKVAEKPTLPEPKKTRPVLIRELCNPKGYTCYFDTVSDAKDGAEQVRKMLQRLRSFIEDNAAPQQKQTFDF